MVSKQKHRTKEYKNLVTNYYTYITDPYYKTWGEHFHLALFKNNTETFKTAIAKTNKMYLNDSKLKKGDEAVDLGCGVGAMACYVAKSSGAHVTGVNITDYQIKKARELAKKKKVKNVDFKTMDIMNLNESNAYDAVFMIEVGCHLPNKLKALKKVYKALKPGARLIMPDWLQKEKLNMLEKNLLIEPFNDYWNFPYLETFNGMKKLFKKAGFKVIKAQDVSKQTERDWNMMYEMAIKEITTMTPRKALTFVDNPMKLLNFKKYEKVFNNQFNASLFSKACFDAGVLKFGYFVLEKKRN